MTDQMQSIRDDIVFMRALAQEGRHAPIVSGRNLVIAGLAYGTASLVQWAWMAGFLAMPGYAIGLTWLVALTVQIGGTMAFKRRLRETSGANTAGNRAIHAAWSGVGFSIFTIFIGLAVATWRLRDEHLINLFPSVILALYGASWMVAAIMSRMRWLGGVAVAAYLASVGVCFVIDRPVQYLIYAVALYLLAALPGYLLMRGEPADVI